MFDGLSPKGDNMAGQVSVDRDELLSLQFTVEKKEELRARVAELESLLAGVAARLRAIAASIEGDTQPFTPDEEGD